MSEPTNLPAWDPARVHRFADRLRQRQTADRVEAQHREAQRQRGRTVPRTCQQCGADFLAARNQVTKGRALYCGMACYRLAVLARRPVRICAGCGQSFQTAPKYRTQRYCSRTCLDATNPLWKRGRWWAPEGYRRCTDPAGRHHTAGESPILPVDRFDTQGPHLASWCRDCRRAHGNRYVHDRYHRDAAYRQRCIDRAGEPHRRKKAARDARRDRVPELIGDLVAAGWQVKAIAAAIGTRRSTVTSWYHSYVRPEMKGVQAIEELWERECGGMEVAA